MRISVCVSRVCILCPQRCVCEVKSRGTLTHCGELWEGGGLEIARPEPPLSALTVALSALVIMAVLPRSCLFGAGPKRKKVGRC